MQVISSRKQLWPTSLLSVLFVASLCDVTTVVDAQCVGIELTLNGQVFEGSTLYRPIGDSGDFIMCQKCDDNINKPTWHTDNGTKITSCKKTVESVCTTRQGSSSRGLTFSGFRPSLVGKYECRLTGGVDKSINIRILDPPVIIKSPMSHIVASNTEVTLNCEASSLDNSVQYHWEKKSFKDSTWTIIASARNMNLKPTSMESQQYRCAATNNAGRTNSEVANITVLQITGHPQSKTVPVNSTTSLTCSSSVKTNSRFIWTHEGRLIKEDIIAMGDTSTLTLTKVKESDAGRYTCIVRSESLIAVSNSAFLSTVKLDLPVITVHPKGEEIPLGMSTTLQCKADGLGTLVYTWERRQPDQTWNAITDYNSTTHNVTDTGYYRCRVNNEAGSVVSQRAEVNVYGRPTITVNPTGGSIPLGSNISLHCEGSGKGSLVYSWMRMENDREWIVIDNTNVMTYTTSVGGLYRCYVRNEAGPVISEAAQVNLYGVPVITTHPASQLTTAGTDVSLNCEGISGGELVYYWEHKITNGSWAVVTNSNTKTYVIKSIQDTEQYRCVVSNEVGDVMSNPAMVRILEITTHPQDRLVPVGSSVSLTCTSSVSSDVTFSWTHNGRGVTGQSTSTGDTSILTITSVRSSDDGSYVCTVRSGSLSVMSDTATMTSYGSPVITSHPSSIAVGVGNNFSLSCEASGQGSILYSWEMYNGGSWQAVGSTAVYTAEASTDGVALYRCVATNEAGSVHSNTATINVYGPPRIQELPEQVHVVSGDQFEVTCMATNHQDSPMNLTFSWETPNGVVYNYTTTDEDDGRTASSTLHISSVVHSGEYRCVAAIGGTLSASTTTNIVAEAHSSRPQHFSVVSNDINSLVLKWRNPAHPHGLIDHFKVYYAHNGQLEHVKVTLTESSGTYTLDNLRPYTEYSVYVTAVRLIGTTGRLLEGEKSRTVTARTLAGKPVIVTYDEDDIPNNTMNLGREIADRNTIVVELPTVSLQNGPFSHLYIVVHTASDQLITDTESISTEDLLEESTKTTPLFYVAGVVNASQYVPGHRMTYILGAGDNTTDPDGRVFYNREVDGTFLFFFRVFSVSSTQQREIATTTLVKTAVVMPQEGVKGDDEGNGDGSNKVLVIGAIAAILTIIFFVVLILIVLSLLHRSRRSRSYQLGIAKSGSTIDDNVVGTTYRDNASFSDTISESVTDSGAV